MSPNRLPKKKKKSLYETKLNPILLTNYIKYMLLLTYSSDTISKLHKTKAFEHCQN